MAQDEIIELARMRNCWLRAEEIFRIRLRAICSEWEGDRKRASCHWRALLDGRTKHVPAELVFVTDPLVEVITSIRKSRERLDKAMQMAIAADPLASGKGVLMAVPEGYISHQNALEILQVPSIGNLVGHARMLALARAVKVSGGGAAHFAPTFYPREDIERARELDQEEISARLDRRLRNATRDRSRGNQTGMMSLGAAARRLGAGEDTIIKRGWLPSLQRIGHRWKVAITDVVAFEQKEREFQARIANGQLLTGEEASKRVGVKRGSFWQLANDLGIQQEWLRLKAFYSLADVEKAARHMQDRRALRNIFRPPRTSTYPDGAIPLKDALAKVGLTERQFQRVREGLSGTPIPHVRKAASGRLYCLPSDLETYPVVH